MPGPAPAAPAPASPGIKEFVERVLVLGVIGPLRLPFGIVHEVPLDGNTVELAHINTSGKPQFVEIRPITGQPTPVIFISSQQSVNVEQSMAVNLAAEVFRCVTYPSDKLFIRKQVPGVARVIVTEVNL
jgi:hypothetical protein